MTNEKKILFLTGTRADYGKLKSLMWKIQNHNQFELKIFATGMHMLSKYGLTWKEIKKDGFEDIYKYINQQEGTTMDLILSNTVTGLSNYVHEEKPDLIVVHGDRLEALAGAIVGAFNNIKVAHIEGGEVSGTIDESIRHSITKLAHIHFVSNEQAKKRVLQLGEVEESIYVIGSPDVDIMLSDTLPSLEKVRERYQINYDNYGILLYHPVTTQLEKIKKNVNTLLDALGESNKNYVVIYPNNDEGNEVILKAYKSLDKNEKFKIFPSLRFEYFLTLLKHSDFIIGNSSAGIREAEIFGIQSIDIGNRQNNRYDKYKSCNIINVTENKEHILEAIDQATSKARYYSQTYGKGNSDEQFLKILIDSDIWNFNIQKYFNDKM
ncbi:UDP-N-acetylglucosamine 2-epimerase [Paraliobacillus sp. JSM ZJ581]|uniref:UDP-N-acetylglucosamine 2-epimerase n=1 Tax=Paraliobacillus sp. JSM ZJ581 TaxID=3342118 RepID=UPI0035A88F08